MSTALARQEMRRFLSNKTPEVLSISGRWGVGKTFGWREALDECRDAKTAPMARYAYVSAFGVKSIESLKTTIFQATVKLDASSIEPTIESFQDNLSTIGGLLNLAERGGRKGLNLAQKIAAILPYGDKAADLILPGAALLIKNQIICIDDIERTGDGLDVSDILGFVSMLREEKGCKVVLLLNEEGLGEDKAVFRKHLEKVVDQAIHYVPTAVESASAALDTTQPLDAALARQTEQLGITNIRVIKRIRRFLGYLVLELAGMHPSISEQAIATTALLGWCVFEPALAPDLAFVEALSDFSKMFAKIEPTDQEAQWNAQLSAYGFTMADDFDLAILAGLQTGGFDMDAIKREANTLNAQYAQAGVREGIRKPWTLLGESFDENEDVFRAAIIESVETYAEYMAPSELDDALSTLKELGDAASAARLLPLYMAAQGERSREFFNLSGHMLRRPIDPAIVAQFDARLKGMPLARDPKEILLKIDRDSGWNPEDEAFLSSLSDDDYYAMLKTARGDELRSVVKAGLMFGEFQDARPNQRAIASKVKAALKRIGEENPLNALRVRPYVGRDEVAVDPVPVGDQQAQP
jgi:hypothetical protein